MPTITKKHASSYLMRTSGPELFYSLNYAALATQAVPKQVQITRPWYKLMLRLRFRDVIAVANMASLYPEALVNLIQRVRLTGNHARFGSQVPLDLSGADIWAYARLLQRRGNSLFINNVRQPYPDTPFSAIPLATYGNIGTYDVEVDFELPLTPFGQHVRDHSKVPYLFMPQDWGDTLQLQVTWADATAFGVAGVGTTHTFTAFGSGAGTPSLDIMQDFVQLGPLRNSIKPGLVIRSNNPIQGGILTGAAVQTRLSNLQKQKTTNIIVKTGTLAAGTSAGVLAFATLSDVILEQTIVKTDNRPVRNMRYNSATKDSYSDRFGTEPVQGYLVQSFVDGGNLLTAYAADDPNVVPAGANFELDSDVVGPAAANYGEIIQEQILGDAVTAAASS